MAVDSEQSHLEKLGNQKNAIHTQKDFRAALMTMEMKERLKKRISEQELVFMEFENILKVMNQRLDLQQARLINDFPNLSKYAASHDVRSKPQNESQEKESLMTSYRTVLLEANHHVHEEYVSLLPNTSTINKDSCMPFKNFDGSCTALQDSLRLSDSLASLSCTRSVEHPDINLFNKNVKVESRSSESYEIHKHLNDDINNLTNKLLKCEPESSLERKVEKSETFGHQQRKSSGITNSAMEMRLSNEVFIDRNIADNMNRHSLSLKNPYQQANSILFMDEPSATQEMKDFRSGTFSTLHHSLPYSMDSDLDNRTMMYGDDPQMSKMSRVILEETLLPRKTKEGFDSNSISNSFSIKPHGVGQGNKSLLVRSKSLKDKMKAIPAVDLSSFSQRETLRTSNSPFPFSLDIDEKHRDNENPLKPMKLHPIVPIQANVMKVIEFDGFENNIDDASAALPGQEMKLVEKISTPDESTTPFFSDDDEMSTVSQCIQEKKEIIHRSNQHLTSQETRNNLRKQLRTSQDYTNLSGVEVLESIQRSNTVDPDVMTDNGTIKIQTPTGTKKKESNQISASRIDITDISSGAERGIDAITHRIAVKDKNTDILIDDKFSRELGIKTLPFEKPEEALRHEMAKDGTKSSIAKASLGTVIEHEIANEISTSFIPPEDANQITDLTLSDLASSVNGKTFSSKGKDSETVGKNIDDRENKDTTCYVKSNKKNLEFLQQLTRNLESRSEDFVRQSPSSISIADANREIDTSSHPNSSDNISNNLTSITKKDQQIAMQYTRMLKVGVALEGVRHKMAKDGVKPSIVTYVLSTVTKEVDHSSLSPWDTSIGAVSNGFGSLSTEKGSNSISDGIRETDTSTQPSDSKDNSSNCTSISKEDHQIAMHYTKMLKVGVAVEGVCQKMANDGVNPNVVSYVLSTVTEDPKHSSLFPWNRNKGADSNETAFRSANMNNLSIADSVKLESSQEVSQFHIPQQAKFSSTEKQSKTPESVALPSMKNGILEKSRPSGGRRYKGLHWTPLTDKEIQNSIWKAKSNQNTSMTAPATIDITKLIELFQKRSMKAPVANYSPVRRSRSKGNPVVINIQRANNIAIGLRAFKDLTYKELADLVNDLDPSALLTEEQIDVLKGIIPNAREVNDLRAYKGDEKNLAPPELFLREMVSVKRAEVKVAILKSMISFQTASLDLLSNFKTLESACKQVTNSVRLPEVLMLVLQLGNIMNEGTTTGGASGFKFDSLLKLSQTKSSDGRTTLLDFIVMMFISRNNRDALDLETELSDCHLASKLSISEMTASLKAMSSTVVVCKEELNEMQQEPGLAANKAMMLSTFKGSSLRRIQSGRPLNEQLVVQTMLPKSQHHKEVDGRLRGNPSFLDELRCRLPVSNESGSLPESSEPFKSITIAHSGILRDSSMTESSQKLPETSQLASVSRLNQFIAEADETLSNVKDCMDAAFKACRELSTYCGESDNVHVASKLLEILSQFVSNLNKATKDHDIKCQAKAKKIAPLRL
jgi:Formin Homology 2 Domain/Subunit CCDC53 of WASH complex